MTIFLIILSALCFAAGIVMLFRRILVAPALAYIGLLILSFTSKNGYPVLPINGYILVGWLCMTIVVTFAMLLESPAVRAQLRGMPYIVIGGLTGLAVGLLGFTITSSASLLYSIMILGVIAGIFLGFLLYTRTPEGAPVAPGSGHFFRYILAKGFPTAVTLMMVGVVLVLAIAISR